MPQPDAGVESFCRNIDHLLAGGKLHLDLGIGFAEGCDQRLQQDRDNRARYGEAQQSGRPLTEPARNLAGSDKFLEGGLGARKKPFAGLG